MTSFQNNCNRYWNSFDAESLLLYLHFRLKLILFIAAANTSLKTGAKGMKTCVEGSLVKTSVTAAATHNEL